MVAIDSVLNSHAVDEILRRQDIVHNLLPGASKERTTSNSIVVIAQNISAT